MQRPRHRYRCLAAGVALACLAGCTRHYYRDFADRDVYRIERERMTDPRWATPARPVEAAPKSRIGDVHDPDREPIPPDDPASRPFQVSAGRPFEFHGWKKRGRAPVEDLAWLGCIPRDADGDLVLDGRSAMQVAVMNSRDYQTQVEQVYLTALSLTLARFAFFPQGLGNQTTQFRHAGSGVTNSNQLQLFTQEAVNWSFYSGAQLLVNFANSMIFEYNGKGFQTVNSGLLVSLTQPLLRGAFARNVTQPLSLGERATLYTVRNFAHFRRQFYVATVSGYLELLAQVQQVRNLQSQVDALKRNLDEYNALVRAGLIDSLQRDNIAQSYQTARLGLLGQEASFQTSLDAYRVDQLGMPADFPIKVDEALLRRFELNDPKLDDLRSANDKLYLSLLQYDAPPAKPVMADTARSLLDEFRQLVEVAGSVEGELARWRGRLEAGKGRIGAGSGPLEQDERESYERQVKLAAELGDAYAASRVSLAENIRQADAFLAKLDGTTPEEAWEKIRQNLVGQDFRARLAELFVIQTQVRVYLIEVAPVPLTLDQAVSVAIGNRLDLMNSLGEVTDAWRNVEYGANQLQAGLNVFYNGSLNTDPKHAGIFRFDPSASSHAIGLRFDAPINRRVERNAYRADQIQFQRNRRAYMLTHDQIVQQVRLDMRTLNLSRRQFEISREALLIAARQVDSAEFNARNSTGANSGGGQSAGLNLANALNGLLGAKNGLIGNWIQYEVQRMGLFRDFDTMNIDAGGTWTNDGDIPTLDGGGVAAAPDPVGSGRDPLLPGPAMAPDPVGAGAGPVVPPLPGSPGPFPRP